MAEFVACLLNPLRHDPLARVEQIGEFTEEEFEDEDRSRKERRPAQDLRQRFGELPIADEIRGRGIRFSTPISMREPNMAEKLDPRQVATFEELLRATMMYEAKAGGSGAQLRAQSG